MSAGVRLRLAEAFGVDAQNLLPVRGTLHGVELICRRLALDGKKAVAAQDRPGYRRLADIYQLDLNEGEDAGARFIESPGLGGAALSRAEAARLAPRDGLLIIDETFIEAAGKPSLTSFAVQSENVVTIRPLTFLDTPLAPRVAALIGSPALIDRLESVLEPDAFPVEYERLVRNALAPARLAALAAAHADWRAERALFLDSLSVCPGGARIAASDGPQIAVFAENAGVIAQGLRAFGVPFTEEGAGIVLTPGERVANQRALQAFGARVAAPRAAEVMRETLETKIVVRVDLDRQGAPQIASGIGYFDHMLAQIATHGGFSLFLACDGDPQIDAHHTLEDCALALGEALSKALGERRGVTRFGFVLPMDETQAQVSLDLGGRPYSVFEGAFKAPLLGAYPTEMTEHVFRSLAQTLGAAIHIKVVGANDHHMTEAAFKAFGRALRQAIAVSGDGVPSTKGVL